MVTPFLLPQMTSAWKTLVACGGTRDQLFMRQEKARQLLVALKPSHTSQDYHLVLEAWQSRARSHVYRGLGANSGV